MNCDKLFETIDTLEDEYCQFLIDICNIESPTDYKQGVDAVGKYFIKKAESKGWHVEVQNQLVSGDCVCITLNPSSKSQSVCFSGHMDTVHPIGSFGSVPTKLDGDIIYGPGVTDCKGGIVASFMAMDALSRLGFSSRPIKLILQSDEENGSRFSNKSTVRFMAEQAKNCLIFLNTEPCVTGRVCIATKGIRKYSFLVTGKSVHSGSCYNGASAIAECARKIIELEKYKDEETITCNCGLISGGVAENIVPDKCVFTADFRFKSEKQSKIVEKIAKDVAQKSFIENTSCTLTQNSWRHCMEKNEKSLVLVEKINEIFKEVGLTELREREDNGGSDAADMSFMGIPCLDGLGVLGGRIHSREEYMYKSSLKDSAKRLASIAYLIK